MHSLAHSAPKDPRNKGSGFLLPDNPRTEGRKNLKKPFSIAVVPRFCCTFKCRGRDFKNPGAQVLPS